MFLPKQLSRDITITWSVNTRDSREEVPPRVTHHSFYQVLGLFKAIDSFCFQVLELTPFQNGSKRDLSPHFPLSPLLNKHYLLHNRTSHP